MLPHKVYESLNTTSIVTIVDGAFESSIDRLLNINKIICFSHANA